MNHNKLLIITESGHPITIPTPIRTPKHHCQTAQSTNNYTNPNHYQTHHLSLIEREETSHRRPYLMLQTSHRRSRHRRPTNPCHRQPTNPRHRRSRHPRHPSTHAIHETHRPNRRHAIHKTHGPTPSSITRKEEKKDGEEVEKEERGWDCLRRKEREGRERGGEKEYFNEKRKQKLNKIYYFFLALCYSAHLSIDVHCSWTSIFFTFASTAAAWVLWSVVLKNSNIAI